MTQTENLDRTYDLRAFSLTYLVSFLIVCRQDPQPASNTTDTVQDGPHTRSAGEVCPLGRGHKCRFHWHCLLGWHPLRRRGHSRWQHRSYFRLCVTERFKRSDALRQGDVSYSGFDQRYRQRWPRYSAYVCSLLLSFQLCITAEKVTIDQESLKHFINKVSPGAYVSLTRINFRVLDNTNIKTVGVYGSKERIVDLLLEVGAIEPHLSVVSAASSVVLAHH